MPVCETGNGTGSTTETGSEIGTDEGTEAAHWTDCWFVDGGGAVSSAGVESTRGADCAEDAAGSWDPLPWTESIGWAGLAQGEERKSAEEEEWREEEGEAGWRGEERGGCRRCCGC